MNNISEIDIFAIFWRDFEIILYLFAPQNHDLKSSTIFY